MVDSADTCLNKRISLNNCEAINVEGTCSARDVLSGGYIRSNNKDPEVLVNIVFLELVNLNGILIEGPNKEKLPGVCRMYVNNPTIDIADIENLKAVEVLALSDTNIGKKIALKIAKFKNVSSLNVKLIFLNLVVLFE